jgi:uncharacterized coiled-coil DUF342 family protein
LLSQTLRTAGRTALIVAGAAFGLMRGLRVLGNINHTSAGLEMIEARVDTIHVAVARLANQTEQLQSKLDRTVTKDELSQTLDELFGRIEQGVDARFEHQTRSVQALRMMIGQTDELLQRVLDGLESMKDEADGEQDRVGDLTPASR